MFRHKKSLKLNQFSAYLFLDDPDEKHFLVDMKNIAFDKPNSLYVLNGYFVAPVKGRYGISATHNSISVKLSTDGNQTNLKSLVSNKYFNLPYTVIGVDPA